MIDLYLADNLDDLARAIEMRSISDYTIKSSLLKYIREPALTYYGITLPSTPASYTTVLTSTLKIRPPASAARLHLQELDSPDQAPIVAGFELKGQRQGDVVGGSYGMGTTHCLALCAAIARTWSVIIRRKLAGTL